MLRSTGPHDVLRRRSAMRRPSSVLAVLSVLVLFAHNLPLLQGQQVRATEAQVKAAFLFNFGKYVSWPTTAGDRFSICVYGQDPFGTGLDALVAGENIGGKRVDVRRIAAVSEASTCNVLFISSSEDSQLQSILASLARVPVLTVGDAPRFLERGGMIQFINEGGRIRFMVNLSAAQKTGLALSSELLKVAKTVQRDGAGAM